MSFVMIATGATSRSRVRTLSLPQLLSAFALAALGLLGAGGAAGYWLGAPPRELVATAAVATAAIAALPQRPPTALPFTLEQLGAISARLFRLESQALQLGKRLGVGTRDGAEARPADKPPGRGGPMLPARGEIAGIEALDAELARIEGQIDRVADAASEHSLVAMQSPTRRPVQGGELSSPFGNRHDPFAQRPAFHAGLDFAAEHGTPIVAAGGGRVRFAGFRSDYGWMVEIEHGNGLATRYAHASRLLVTQGALVMPGERIAMVGSTGRSTGAHLHFEVLRQGAQVDPKRYLAGL